MTQSAVIRNRSSQACTFRRHQSVVHVNQTSTDPKKWSSITSSRDSCSVVVCRQFTCCHSVLHTVALCTVHTTCQYSELHLFQRRLLLLQRERTEVQVQVVVEGSDARGLRLPPVSSSCSICNHFLVKRAETSASVPVRVFRLALSNSFFLFRFLFRSLFLFHFHFLFLFLCRVPWSC